MSAYSEAELYYKLDNMILSSTLYLRQAFKNRWKDQTGENWTDSQTQKNTLLSSLTPLDSKNKKCPLQSFQQKTMKEKDVGEWDLSLLSGILLLQRGSSQGALDRENEAVRKLKNIRNALAHDDTGTNATDKENCSRRCSLEEFQKHSNTFKDCLLCLGVDESTVDKIIEKSGVTSSLKALERAKKLYTVAEKLINETQLNQAIDLYTDAIGTPSLLPEHQAEAYEKRAACFLKYTDRIDDYCDQALSDATKALELNGISWKAHYYSAQCYRHKNKFEKAIEFYQQALALSPVQTQVRRDLESCQVLSGVLIHYGDVSTDQLPESLQELIAKLEIETGEKLTEDEYIKHKLKSWSLLKGHDHVFRGHQYYYGWGVVQNYNEAVKYYTKAAKLGDPIGTYNQGLCYGYGRGVEQNVHKALQTFKRAAAMDPDIPGEQTILRKNYGVAAAQNSLGYSYYMGIGVDQNYYQAYVWYKKGMENGNKPSAVGLGILYYQGLGVKMNETMAENCWKTAMNWGSKQAPVHLMQYYISKMEPEKALDTIKVGRELGSEILLDFSDKELNIVLEEIKRKRKEMLPAILEHEAKYRLNSKGWLFEQRWMRFISFENPDILTVDKVMEMERKRTLFGVDGSRGLSQPITMDIDLVLKERALSGSEIAIKSLQALAYLDELSDVLNPIRQYSEVEEMRLMDLLYESTILQAYLDFPFGHREDMEHLKTIVRQLFEQKCEETGEEDMKIRLCHVIYNLPGSWRSSTDIYALEVLKEGVRRYPNNVTYYDYLALCYGFKKDFKKAIHWAERGLEKFPNNIALLHGLCIHLMHDVSTFPKAKEVLFSYLAAAPPDHIKVPEAYYRLGQIYLSELNNGNDDSKVLYHKLIEEYSKKGEDAEKCQLPCYIKGETSTQKVLVRSYLNAYYRAQDNNGPNPPTNEQNDKEKDSSQKVSVFERKPYLQSPLRKSLLIFHREKLKTFNSLFEHGSAITLPPKLKQCVPAKLSGMVPITLNEMNPTEDFIFENTFLELIIIEDPNPFYYSIHCVAEDNNGDPTNLYIYNVEKDAATLKMFQPGCKLAILNPYMRIGSLDNVNGIRNDKPECIIYLRKAENMCRFCGEENAARKCSKCKRYYCSHECQKLDWDIFKHKLICSIQN